MDSRGSTAVAITPPNAAAAANLADRKPSISADQLTPIVLNQLQSTNKLKEGNRKLKRGSSRSSQNSTPASNDQNRSGRSSGNANLSNGNENSLVVPQQKKPNDWSESESSCGEESRRRTAEAFMSGIQSAIQEKSSEGKGVENSGLSAELVGEVESVLGKLMSSLQQGDPSLIPLITSLQMSLKKTVNQEGPAATTKSENNSNGPVVSELFGNEGAFSNIEADDVQASSSKIPWKIRAARKRALKHHTTGMTKDEFAQIKQSLSQSAMTCKH